MNSVDMSTADGEPGESRGLTPRCEIFQTTRPRDAACRRFEGNGEGSLLPRRNVRLNYISKLLRLDSSVKF